jgi:chlorobactene glucosyltransferase
LGKRRYRRTVATFYQSGILFLLLGMLVNLSRNLRLLGKLEAFDHPDGEADGPLVSILIPARNEERCIERCLRSLATQRYTNTEILVLDDQSDDRTSEIVVTIAREYPSVRLLQGSPLPLGWVGKPWACQQLGREACGDLLLFVDADTWFAPEAIGRMVTAMSETGADVVSAVPWEETITYGERLAIPTVHFAFLAPLPLDWMERQANPKLAIAIGQFLGFTREIYERIDGHEQVADRILDDLGIARVVKRHGGRILIVSAVEGVGCRMYQSWDEVRRGFAKNAFALHNERMAPAAATEISSAMLFIVPAALVAVNGLRRRFTVNGFWLPLLQYAIAVICRFQINRRFRFPLIDSLAMPASISAQLYILANSIWWRRHPAGYHWKGRNYPQAGISPEPGAPSASGEPGDEQTGESPNGRAKDVDQVVVHGADAPARSR